MEENAYSLLTNIQGFDSFSLSPSSTNEEIARAFQTQSAQHTRLRVPPGLPFDILVGPIRSPGTRTASLTQA